MTDLIDSSEFREPKTIFCDLDGTLVRHCGDPLALQNPTYELEVLPGVKEALCVWDKKRYHVVITTGRKESTRDATVKQLQRAGILYDQLIMGFGGGDRVLINDKKCCNNRGTAYSINVERNVGLLGVDV